MWVEGIFFKKVFNNIKLPVLFLIALYFAVGCSTLKKEYSFKIDSLKTYGDNAKNILSLIGDFKYRNGKVYILDIMQKQILIFALEGKLKKKIQLRSGKGPGDVSMGLIAFEVISDTTLAILDALLKRVQLISTNYNYLNSFYVKFMPNNIFYRDSLLYISGNDLNSLIYIYNLNGQKIGSLIKPFKLKDLSQPWFSNVNVENDVTIFYTNPYKTEIRKWVNNSVSWSFSDDKLDLISLPVVRNISGRISIRNPDKGWANLFIFKNYVIASTYNYKSEVKREVKPKILLIDKNTGKLLYIKNVETPFIAHSFENGKYVFMTVDEPYPHLERIDIKIKRE